MEAFQLRRRYPGGPRRIQESSRPVGKRQGREQGMWDKNDWHQFFQIAQRPWRRRRPPRPVYPTGVNRILPAVGFSLSELDDAGDRKSTRLNSSHLVISYAVFCLKKKKKTNTQ